MLHRLLMRLVQWYLAKYNLGLVHSWEYEQTLTSARVLHDYTLRSGFLTNKAGKHYRASKRVRQHARLILEGLDQHARYHHAKTTT